MRNCECISEAKFNLARFVVFFNKIRPHRGLNDNTPDKVCLASSSPLTAAANRAETSLKNA